MCPGTHGAVELRMCVQSRFHALDPQHMPTLDGGSWRKDSLNFNMVLEEYRSIEVQERLGIIISHGPSFLPSSFSLLLRDFLTSPWNNPSRMAI